MIEPFDQPEAPRQHLVPVLDEIVADTLLLRGQRRKVLGQRAVAARLVAIIFG